ncbi:MAG: L,D-transpeptidase family protein [Gaiellales bacterium]
MRRSGLVTVVFAALVAAGCGARERVTPEAMPVDAHDAPVTRVHAARCDTLAVERVAAHGLAVRVVRPTVARVAPGGPMRARFGLRNVNGVRTVFAVRSVRRNSVCEPAWYRVQLPVRPNGLEGWVPARDVRVFELRTAVTVDLSERTVRVVRDGRTVLVVRAAVGAPATPTPRGRFYVNQRLWASDPTGPWGPGGVGISAFSPVLRDWAQGGPIAIHGTNQPHLLGGAISHGCVRVSNYALLRLMRLAPEGTPVEIRA